MNGRKRHICVDTLGLILSLVITGADMQDRRAALLVLDDLAEKDLGESITKIFADNGYTGSLAETCKLLWKWDLEVVPRNKETKKFVVLPKRWIVERTFAWLGRYRRLSKDYETLPNTVAAFIKVAMINLMLHRLCR